MPPNTAPTAPSTTPDAAAASDAPAVDNFGFPTAADMDTSTMSDAELDAFVDKTLGISNKGGTNAPTTPTNPEPAPADPQAVVSAPAAVPSPEPAPPSPVVTPEPEAPAPAAAPEPAAQLDTSDLWISVKNADGNDVTLKLDDGIPEDFMFKDDKQLFEVLDSFQEMKQLRADRQAAIDKQLADQEAASASERSTQTILEGWNNEMAQLEEAGFLSKPKDAPADGKMYTAAETAADPALQERDAIWTFMKATNEQRAKENKPPIMSFTTAYTLYNKDKTSSADAAALKQENDLAKKKGGVVGGTSAPAGGGTKGYVYKRGSARNIWQVDTSDI